jgi:hypothetical protein
MVILTSYLKQAEICIIQSYNAVLVYGAANCTEYDLPKGKPGTGTKFRKSGEIRASPRFAARSDTRRYLRRTTRGAVLYTVQAG